MGGRWMWMGMVGLCALASGCREEDGTPQAVTPPVAPVQARDTANGGLMAPAMPVRAQAPEEDARLRGNATSARVAPDTAPPPGSPPLSSATGTNAPAPARRAQATPARDPALSPPQGAAVPNANTTNAQAQAQPSASPGTRPASQANGQPARQANAQPAQQANGQPAQQANAQPAPANAQPAQQANAQAAPANGQPAQANAQPADQGRVMIGAAAVQASDDEAWYEGAAKATQAAATNTGNQPLEQVVIASSTVSGKVARVGRDSLHVRDGEGTVYELQLDPRSRGLRQGRRVPLRELEEGTPVRAQFVLMGGRTIARDVQVRR